MREDINKLEVHVQDGGQLNVAIDNGMVYAAQNNGNESANIQQKVKSRTQEYLDKWNANMFLNDFDKRDENAGVNVKLSEVYLDEQLPHYIWGDNINVLYDLKDLLSEYIYLEKRKMLLILGQPGIGKSTLITWITANFTNCIEKILIYKFAPDLQKINWKIDHVFEEILWTLGLTFNALNRKILILDGFDEVNIEDNRIDILNNLYEELMHQDGIKDFSLILTCRENYVQELNKLRCKYITLELWNDAQITNFYRIFKEKTKASRA